MRLEQLVELRRVCERRDLRREVAGRLAVRRDLDRVLQSPLDRRAGRGDRLDVPGPDLLDEERAVRNASAVVLQRVVRRPDVEDQEQRDPDAVEDEPRPAARQAETGRRPVAFLLAIADDGDHSVVSLVDGADVGPQALDARLSRRRDRGRRRPAGRAARRVWLPASKRTSRFTSEACKQLVADVEDDLAGELRMRPEEPVGELDAGVDLRVRARRGCSGGRAPRRWGSCASGSRRSAERADDAGERTERGDRRDRRRRPPAPVAAGACARRGRSRAARA